MKTADRDLRDAQLAAALADATRAGAIQAADALRVIKHEMRRRNQNKQRTLAVRSAGAQAVLDRHAALKESPPKNSSDDALHADHVYPLSREQLLQTAGVEAWHELLAYARVVVVVTARENYDLQRVEKDGMTGLAKYRAAGIRWPGEEPRFAERFATV